MSGSASLPEDDFTQLLRSLQEDEELRELVAGGDGPNYERALVDDENVSRDVGGIGVDTAGSNGGSVSWLFDVPTGNLDFLAEENTASSDLGCQATGNHGCLVEQEHAPEIGHLSKPVLGINNQVIVDKNLGVLLLREDRNEGPGRTGNDGHTLKRSRSLSARDPWVEKEGSDVDQGGQAMGFSADLPEKEHLTGISARSRKSLDSGVFRSEIPRTDGDDFKGLRDSEILESVEMAPTGETAGNDACPLGGGQFGGVGSTTHDLECTSMEKMPDLISKLKPRGPNVPFEVKAAVQCASAYLEKMNCSFFICINGEVEVSPSLEAHKEGFATFFREAEFTSEELEAIQAHRLKVPFSARGVSKNDVSAILAALMQEMEKLNSPTVELSRDPCWWPRGFSYGKRAREQSREDATVIIDHILSHLTGTIYSDHHLQKIKEGLSANFNTKSTLGLKARGLITAALISLIREKERSRESSKQRRMRSTARTISQCAPPQMSRQRSPESPLAYVSRAHPFDPYTSDSLAYHHHRVPSYKPPSVDRLFIGNEGPGWQRETCVLQMAICLKGLKFFGSPEELDYSKLCNTIYEFQAQKFSYIKLLDSTL
ncbi:hypothetical protein KFL_006650030 [Klebsormidium nitens]|uniref:Uncharacterized protein n=1 Tax=Klebsormidium nitens TaxID=105231 RepID=A0A1Y1IMF7_KLENI|nr:hypothetical protein KFL_006650030 [Klebsormidium nitens]|eukprot:GAQ90629.1 hypothetical protein KFL_006650030 [Klebsormidium nitens]